MFKTLGAFYRNEAANNRRKSRVAQGEVIEGEGRLKEVVASEEDDDNEESVVANAMNDVVTARGKAHNHAVLMERHAKKASRLDQFKWPVQIDPPFLERSSRHETVVVHRFLIETIGGKKAGIVRVVIPYEKIVWGKSPEKSSAENFSDYKWEEKKTRNLSLDRTMVKALSDKVNPMDAFRAHRTSLRDLYDTMKGLVGNYVTITGHNNVFCGAGLAKGGKQLVFAVSTSRPNFYTFTVEGPVFVVNDTLYRGWSPYRENFIRLGVLMYLRRGRMSGSMSRRSKYWHKETKYHCEREAGFADLVTNTWRGYT